MFQYIFFSAEPCQQFVDWLQQHHIPIQRHGEEKEQTIGIPEDLDEAMLDDIDAFYERMLVLTETLLNEMEGDASRYVAGITLNLSNGQSVQAAIPPELLNKLLSAVTLDELGQFVQHIVDAVEKPDPRPFCQHSLTVE